MLFSDEKITLDTDEKYSNDEFDEEILHMRQLLKPNWLTLTFGKST
jgi:DNA-directed RNA polymerase subunit alpha